MRRNGEAASGGEIRYDYTGKKSARADGKHQSGRACDEKPLPFAVVSRMIGSK